MDVSVISVTYNSADYIGQCLASVRAQKGVQTEIIVVDNASADDTASVVRKTDPETHLILNRENLGFGRACNQGFAASQGRYIYLLNPDAQLVSPDALAVLCSALKEHAQWGMVGTILCSPGGEIVQAQPHLDYPSANRTSADFSSLPGKHAWVNGASMLLPREVYAALGGFDPDFFLYAEDTDLCLRLRKLGYELGFLETVEVRHIGGATELDRDPYDVWIQRTNALILFWKKHYPPEDVRRLVRRERLRSLYRMPLCALGALIQPRRSRAWQNLRQWQATWKACSQFKIAQ